MASRVKAETLTAAVRTASTLLGRDTTSSVVAAPQASRTALVRREFSQYTPYGSWEEMTAAYAASASTPGSTFDVRTSLRNMLDWATPEGDPSKVTKGTVKTVTALLGSHYVQTVEMLGFAAVWAPLLDSSRLLNVIGTASQVSSAYAPERYVTRAARDLLKLLTSDVSVSPERLEALAKSQWLAAHDGRYWDVAGGVKPAAAATRRRNADRDAERAAVADYVAELLDGADPNTADAHAAVLAALEDMSLPFNARTAELVAALPDTVECADHLSVVAERSRRGEWVNPDTLVLVSQIPWLRPGDRPESPMSWLVSEALVAWTDPESGAVAREGWPDKPKAWVDVYPCEPVGAKFPLPSAVYKQHRQMLPGTDMVLTLVRTPNELEENRQHMGNCTNIYRREMEAGTYALFRFTDEGGTDYNAAMVLDVASGRWRLREVNSRFNRGGVPERIKDAFNALIAAQPVVDTTRR